MAKIDTNKFSKWRIVVFLVLFTFGVVLLGCSDDSSDAPEPVVPVSWTIMVYLDADNNLESFAMSDINEMKSGFVNNQGVKLIVLIDRIYGESYDSVELGENFTGTRLYNITNGTATRLGDSTYLGLSSSGDDDELNMGDAETLQKFVQYCKAQQPADKYALILWNHGDGPRKKAKGVIENSVSGLEKGICWDDTDGGDSLYTAEITDVLTSAESVDLLGFDACLMGSVEVAYQFRPTNDGFNAQVMVASPPTEWGDGWRYDEIMMRLSLTEGDNGETNTVVGGNELYYNPSTMTALELGGIIVEEQYDSTVGYSSEALSCYDLTKVDAVKTAVDELADKLVNSTAGDEKTDFETLRGDYSGGANGIFYFDDSELTEWVFWPFFDLYSLSSRLSASGFFVSDVTEKADAVMSAVDDMVVYSFAGADYSGFTSGKNGVYIFCPDGDELINGAITNYNTKPEWTVQWWYNAIDTTTIDPGVNQAYDVNGWEYGKLSWCIDGATSGNSTVENWFEMLDKWFDDITVDGGYGHNNYKY